MTMTTTTKKPKNNKKIVLDNNCFMFEILDLASKQRTNAKKVEVLKEYENLPLKSIFIWNFDETVISMLPEGEVPYGNLKEDASTSGNLSDKIRVASQADNTIAEESLRSKKTSIRNEYTKFYNFVKGGNDSLSSIRREVMFINILEGLHPEEAELLVLVKDKNLSNKYKISFDNVKQAYPDIQWGNRS